MSEFYLLQNPIGQTFFDIFLVKNVFETKRCFIVIALKYAIRRVRINLAAFKLNVTNQLLVYVDDNILGGRVHTVQINKVDLLVTSKETGLQGNTDKTKYMVMSGD